MVELLEFLGWGMLIFGSAGILVALFYVLVVSHIINKLFLKQILLNG
jgi:hypothetical protein